MPQALSVDVRDSDGRARVTVDGEVTRRSLVTLLRTLDAVAAMYSDIVVDLSRATRVDPSVLAHLAETRAELSSRDGGGMAVIGVGRCDPAGLLQDLSNSQEPVATGHARSFTGRVTETEEKRAIAEVSARLRERFPEVSEEVVDEVVASCHHEFDGRPIRDFVPILVERKARDHLTLVPQQRTGAHDDDRS